MNRYLAFINANVQLNQERLRHLIGTAITQQLKDYSPALGVTPGVTVNIEVDVIESFLEDKNAS